MKLTIWEDNHMEKVREECPICGSEMEYGLAFVQGSSNSVGHLLWESVKKVNTKKKNLFGEEKESLEYRSFELLEMKKLIADADDKEDEVGWYCPKCKKVFIAFDVAHEAYKKYND